MPDFDIGDLVFVGQPAPLTQKVTWRILRIEDGTATLSSGQTERLKRAPVSTLTHFRLVEPSR